MIEAVLPAGVATAEAFDDEPRGWLFPPEEVLVSRAVDSRRREFTTGRRCAREALAKLGIPPGPILSGPNREPLWPKDIIGSITHCAGYRAAAVAPAGVLLSIGVDAEPNAPMPSEVDIARPEEREWLDEYLSADPSVCWDRLLFSAKESVYKTWFPLARSWLGFEEASIIIDRSTATFTATILKATDGTIPNRFTGRWLADRGLVITGIALAKPR
jgi:4'-phosphopantetheinyl transferase EntD